MKTNTNIRYELRLIRGENSSVLVSSSTIGPVAKLADSIYNYNADTNKDSKFYAKVEDMPVKWNLSNFFRKCGWVD